MASEKKKGFQVVPEVWVTTAGMGDFLVDAPLPFAQWKLRKVPSASPSAPPPLNPLRMTPRIHTVNRDDQELHCTLLPLSILRLKTFREGEEREKSEAVACVFVQLQISRPDLFSPYSLTPNHPSGPCYHMQMACFSLIVAFLACPSLPILVTFSSTRLQKSRRTFGGVHQLFFLPLKR